MAGAFWVVGEPAGGEATRLSLEIATLVRGLASDAGREAVGILAGPESAGAAGAFAAYLPRVLVVEAGSAERATAAAIAPAVAALAEDEQPELVFLGASPDGRDLAGMLAALLGWGVLANASGATWEDGIAVEASVLGGRTVATSCLPGGHGIVTVRPGAATATPAAAPGVVESRLPLPPSALPAVTVVERVDAAGAVASIEEARVIVAGGRGVGGSEGFRLVEELADALGGAVGASRAAVDSGWIDYAQQVGQTGKIVKPELYVALGISGAIQHKVGMQTAGTIVAVNRDPDAPIGEFADLFVVGDLFEVGPAILAALRERS